ncbi:DEAD/DEAH box helicase [Sediminibacillus albus]|uniref:Superfamily II DNA or RNA helicase, SNF2 family n=1 Tax=Sediminibacillus albus TaxID=407036 RepID=A0A1G8WLR5_9BACI|nr:DEAD/DEAH box helicase [Sediminibacillus albus]SDJ78530.1 Superfamily II DNA or RNA helicase, SNF2 family [Sediminibacillus albus]
MNIILNEKLIKDRCGTVSFKSGDAFYRANKVTFEQYGPGGCEATVAGKEDFHVVIKTDANGDLQSMCSCPALAGITKDCQHIAAVLLALYGWQRSGNNLALHASANRELSNDLLSLFQENRKRTSGHQSHFEDREVVEAVFTCRVINRHGQGLMFGMDAEINGAKVDDIQIFLQRVKENVPVSLTSKVTFDLNVHCFAKETDAVVQLLTEIIDYQSVATNAMERGGNNILVIPPSAWEKLLPLLQHTAYANLDDQKQIYQGIHVSKDILPLQFDLLETKGKGYSLKITGLDRAVVMAAYNTVIHDGKITLVDSHDVKRLEELKRMLDATGRDEIPIAPEQINFFLEKVVPGLKNLGKVTISEGFEQQFEKTPLEAKLFLDRVKNRLLAGLEFHYGKIVINPLEISEATSKPVVFRDIEKEEQILRLMEDSLFTKSESGYFMHNEELEYDFLYYMVPKLQKLTHIYTTTAIRTRLVKENVFPKIRVRVSKERTNWLEFKFNLDGIPHEDIRGLLEALEEKRKYYRLRSGSLLSLETKEYLEIHRFLHNLPVHNGDLENGLRVPVEQSLDILDSVDTSDILLAEDSFRQFWKDICQPAQSAFTVPESLAGILRDYQIHGFQWLKTLASYGFGGILADDMGLGKTVQSIAYILSEVSAIREKQQPVLIVCPSSVTYNWVKELEKFAPDLQTLVIDGAKEKRINQLQLITGKDVIITSYPILRRDIPSFQKVSFHTVFFDEAQAFKNPVTQTARAVKKIQASHRFALTGTPVENSLVELWAIFHVIFPELFLGLQQYSNLTNKAISRRSRPFILRRLKTDVLKELPQKSETIVSTELLPEQKRLYAAYLAKLRHDTLKHLDKQTFRKNKIRILAGLTRLRQICCHPGLFVDNYQGSSAKFEQLMQLVEEAMLSGRRVLIFSQFTKMLDLIGRHLTDKQLAYFYLDGQTPSEERVEICDRFNGGERQLLLISLKAGGTGLNLTGADTVIMYDSWWNPAVEEQAADRAYRIGQKRAVKVIKLTAQGTVEEKMNELQEKKRLLIEEVIDSEDDKASVLTESDIRELLMINEN